jgi:hypothetical protein
LTARVKNGPSGTYTHMESPCAASTERSSVRLCYRRVASLFCTEGLSGRRQAKYAPKAKITTQPRKGAKPHFETRANRNRPRDTAATKRRYS